MYTSSFISDDLPSILQEASRHDAVGNVDLTEAIMNETGETVVNEEPVSVTIVDDDQDINELPTPESMADGTCK